MRSLNIPPAALEAGARALAADAKLNWDDIPQTHNTLRREARAAFLAMLEAWPGMRIMVDIDTGDDAAIKLPLPQEITLNAQDISALDVKSTREGISDDQ